MRKYMTKQDKDGMIKKLSNMVGADIKTALSYLEAEEWCLFEASESITADRKAGLQNG